MKVKKIRSPLEERMIGNETDKETVCKDGRGRNPAKNSQDAIEQINYKVRLYPQSSQTWK